MARKTYRVLTGMHFERDEKGNQAERGPGDIVVLEENEFPAFADKLEPYNPTMVSRGAQAALAEDVFSTKNDEHVGAVAEPVSPKK